MDKKEDTKDTIRLTVLDFIKAYDELQNLNKLTNCVINPTAGYWLGRLSEKLKPIFKAYNESRNELIRTLGDIDEKNNLPSLNKDHKNWGKFNEEHDNLVAVEDTVEFKKIKFSLLQKEAGTESLPPSFWMNVGIHFVEEVTE